jgi:hypothetical protein
MPGKSKKRSALSGAPEKEAPQKPFTTILKWVGIITALTSLTLGIAQVTRLAAEARERRRQILEAIGVAAQQRSSGDYGAAWLAFEQAQKSADEGGELAKLIGHLDEPRSKLRHAQEEVAMEWVRNARPAEGQSYAGIMDKLLPVLVRGAASANGVRKADLLAHVGWAYFLKGRDTPAPLDPAAQYQQALTLDPANPYAHVFWGHWILWQRGPANEAQQHFDAAVTAKRDLPFVRRIELVALHNDRSGGSDGELLRVVNDMRKNHEMIDATTASNVWSIYYFASSQGDDFRKLTAAVPATDQITLIQALFGGSEFDATKIPSREAYLAIFEEAAGERDAALKRWRALRANLPADASGWLTSSADAAIQRLSQPVPAP